MNELNMATKYRVIKLYLDGRTYDEIAEATGISKGSVCNLVQEYKTGDLAQPPAAAISIDELRSLAIDLKKHEISVAQCKALIKLCIQINQLGVKPEDVATWMSVMQDMASGSTHGAQLAQAAIELGKAAAENGKTHAEVMAEYHGKLKACQDLDAQRAGLTQDIEKLKQAYNAEKKQATSELEAITKAKATDQQAFAQQTSELKNQMDEYMQQHHLNWEKVNAVIAMADQKLAGTGLTDEEIQALLGKLISTGSLHKLKKQLESSVQELQVKVDGLTTKEKDLTITVKKTGADNNKLDHEINAKVEYLQVSSKEIEAKTLCLKQLQYLIDRCAHDIYAARLILTMLVCPGNLSKLDCMDLIKMLIGAFEIQLGAKPQSIRNKDGSEEMVCLIPMVFDTSLQNKITLDEAIRKIARYIASQIESEFVPKFVYDREQVVASFRQKSEDLAKVDYIYTAKVENLTKSVNQP